MATLREKLQDRIDAETAEIERIKASGIDQVRDAQTRRATLQLALKALNDSPQLEPLIVQLSKMGIRILEE